MPAIYVDGRELAERLEERYETVMDWARCGKIPRIDTGRRIMFDLDKVIEALRQRVHKEDLAPTGVE
jgi:hypothetical protein